MMQHHHHQRHPPLFSVSSPATLQPPSQQQQQQQQQQKQQQQLAMGHKPVGPTLSVPGIVLYNTGQQQQQQQPGRVSPSSDVGASSSSSSVSKRRQPPLFLSRQRSSAYLFDKNSPSSSSSSQQQPPHSFHRIGGSPPVSAKVPPKQRKFLRSRSAFLGTVSRFISAPPLFYLSRCYFLSFSCRNSLLQFTQCYQNSKKKIIFKKESLRIALFKASCNTNLVQKCLLRLRIY